MTIEDKSVAKANISRLLAAAQEVKSCNDHKFIVKLAYSGRRGVFYEIGLLVKLFKIKKYLEKSTSSRARKVDDVVKSIVK